MASEYIQETLRINKCDQNVLSENEKEINNAQPAIRSEQNSPVGLSPLESPTVVDMMEEEGIHVDPETFNML